MPREGESVEYFDCTEADAVSIVVEVLFEPELATLETEEEGVHSELEAVTSRPDLGSSEATGSDVLMESLPSSEALYPTLSDTRFDTPGDTESLTQLTLLAPDEHASNGPSLGAVDGTEQVPVAIPVFESSPGLNAASSAAPSPSEIAPTPSSLEAKTRTGGAQESGSFLVPSNAVMTPAVVTPPANYVQLSSGIFVPREFAVGATNSAGSSFGNPRTGSPVSQSIGLSVVGAIPGTNWLNISAPGFAPNGDTFPLFPLLTNSTINSAFGYREAFQRHHDGVDWQAPVGQLVRASLSGYVSYASELGGYGRLIEITHFDDQVRSRYAHLSKIFVRPNQWVEQGEVIGLSGNTGFTTGPHLHYELREKVQGEWKAININQIAAAQLTHFKEGLHYLGDMSVQGHSVNTFGLSPVLPVLATPSANGTLQSTAKAVSNQPLEIRIGLQEDVSDVRLTAPNTGAKITIPDATTRAESVWGYVEPGQTIYITQTNGNTQVNGQAIPSVFFVEAIAPIVSHSIQPHSGLVAVDGTWYRGRVLVGATETGLHVVNWVDIESYLQSVVGAEMPSSWHPSALDAQAIAARSYAVVHRLRPHYASWYDMTATIRHQAYKGLASETPESIEAVARTRGQVLVSAVPSIHHVGGVVEALYASTQQQVTAFHQGYGMAQYGAKALAESGMSVDQILRHYYPDSHIGHL